MSVDSRGNLRPRVLRPLADLGIRAATTTLRPLAGVVEAGAEAGLSLELRAVDRVLDSDALERILTAALNSPSIQAALERALASESAARLVDSLFDSGLLDRFLKRLLADDGLWRLVDEVAASPAVTAAISEQGLGFADQLGDEMRSRSRQADSWMERAARRLTHRPPRALPAEPAASSW